MFPNIRMRRMRTDERIRAMFRETNVGIEDLIYPIYIKESAKDGEPEEISTMPGQYRYSINDAIEFAGILAELEKEKTLHENLIKEFLKDAEYGCSDGGYYASWKNTKRCYKGTETPIRSFRYGKGEAAV